MNNCDECLTTYDPFGKKCAYCSENPRKDEKVNNFAPIYISLQTTDYNIDSIKLDPNNGNWNWCLEATAFDDHFYLVINASGIILKTTVQIEDGRWTAEKYRIIAKKLKLPFNRLTVDTLPEILADK